METKMPDECDKIIKLDNDEIWVYFISDPKSIYSAAYRNNSTRDIDNRFGLQFKEKLSEKQIRRLSLLRSGQSALGDSYTESTMYSIFVREVPLLGVFFGFPEKEIIKQYGERSIDSCLKYEDYAPIGGKGPKKYLERITVEGVDVLFPKNLPCMNF